MHFALSFFAISVEFRPSNWTAGRANGEAQGNHHSEDDAKKDHLEAEKAGEKAIDTGTDKR